MPGRSGDSHLVRFNGHPVECHVGFQKAEVLGVRLERQYTTGGTSLRRHDGKGADIPADVDDGVPFADLVSFGVVLPAPNDIAHEALVACLAPHSKEQALDASDPRAQSYGTTQAIYGTAQRIRQAVLGKDGMQTADNGTRGSGWSLFL
jgi:hypothetical protein